MRSCREHGIDVHTNLRPVVSVWRKARVLLDLFSRWTLTQESLCAQVLEWTLLNSFVAYVGYILAAYTIDKPWMGRMRLQSLGFLMSFILFICCGTAYHQLIHPSKSASPASAV